jgi:hypothetical protein
MLNGQRFSFGEKTDEFGVLNSVPLLLGRLNFFAELDVCFYGSQLAFEVCPKQTQ